MTYTDGIHLVATTLSELHEFAARVGLKRCWYEGKRRGHPHYDLANKTIRNKVIEAGAVVVSSKEIVTMFNDGRLEK